MTGLYLLLVGVVWLAILALFVRALTSRISLAPARLGIAIVLFLAMLPLPMLDELIGKREFAHLCQINSAIRLNRAAAAGGTVYFDPQPPMEAPNTAVRIVLLPHRYVDPASGEPVLSYTTLTANGGVLVRTLGISEGGVPLTFLGTCGPSESPRSAFASLGITPIDRPK